MGLLLGVAARARWYGTVSRPDHAGFQIGMAVVTDEIQRAVPAGLNHVDCDFLVAKRAGSETLQGFLSAWLTFHILGEDQSMARQIARVEAGDSAEIAYELEAPPKDNSSAALLQALKTLYGLLAEQNRELADTNQRLLEEIAAHRS